MTTLLLLAALAQGGPGAPQFTRFEVSRERVAHRVIVNAQLVNTLGIALNDVRVTVAYYDHDREVRRSRATSLGRLSPGQTVAVLIETDNVEKFDRFELTLQSGDRDFTYTGSDPTKPPDLKLAPPPRLELVSAKDLKPQLLPGTVAVTLTVRNGGVSKAREPTAVLAFLDASGNEVLKVRASLAPAVDQASEEVFEVTVPRCPAYASLQPAVICLENDIAVPPDPIRQVAEIEVGQCSMVRLTDRSVRVRGTLRNGLADSIKDVKVSFTLGKAEHLLAIPGPIRGASARTFEFYVPNCPPVQGYEYSAGYDGAGNAPDGNPDPPPSARRTASRELKEVEIAGGRSSRLVVELRGMKWIRGLAPGGKRTTGEYGFLKVAFRDPAGKSLHPTGQIAASLTDGTKPPVTASRAIKEDTWTTDSDDLTEQNVTPEALAYDALNGELWVGLIRTDKPSFTLKADVTLTLPGFGVWEWKGLADRFEAPARGPDRK